MTQRLSDRVVARTALEWARLKRARRRRMLHLSLGIALLLGASVALGTLGASPPRQALAGRVPVIWGDAIGGYVLTGVVAFALGVLMTMVCNRGAGPHLV